MKIKIIISFLLFSIVVKAQEYKLFVAATDKSIQLKWMSKDMEKSMTFDVFRKEDNGSWNKINDKTIEASPIIKESELKTSKNNFPKDSTYTYYVTVKNTKEMEPNKESYANYILAIQSVYNNELAFHLGIFYEDITVLKGKKYQYKVLQSETQKELAISSSISLGDVMDSVKEVKATQEKQNVNLTWRVSDEFIGYTIYKDNQKLNKEPIMANLEDKIYKVSYKDENLKPGNYKYVVKGVSFLNTESKPSTEVIITVKDATPATGIKGLKVIRNENEIKLKWIASTDKEAKGYFVYKSEDKGKTFKKINPSALDVQTQEFNDKVTQGFFGTLNYFIETIDAFGNVSKSMPVSVFIPDHQAPEMPREVTAKPESGKISLSWKINTEKDLLGYRVYRGLKDNDENSMLLLNVKPQTETTYIDIFSKKSSTKFIYKVAAVDLSFHESEKAAIWVQLPDVVPPSTPFLKEAVLNENRVVLKWNLMPNESIMGYDVYRNIDDKKEKINTSLITQDNFVDDKILQKGLYQYYIQAIDSAKLVSKPSNSLFVSTIISNTKTILKLVAKQEVKSKKVQLEIIGIKPDEVQSIKLYRKTGYSGFRIIPTQINNSSFIDETTESGKIYQYYIEVIDFNEVTTKSDIINFNNP